MCNKDLYKLTIEYLDGTATNFEEIFEKYIGNLFEKVEKGEVIIVKIDVKRENGSVCITYFEKVGVQ